MLTIKPLTILVVDDEEGIRKLLSAFFNLKGCRTLLARDGVTALELLAVNDVHLVISDVQMPLMDGYELSSRIKSLYPAVKVQLMSGFHEVDDSGVDPDLIKNLIEKPFLLDDLWARVETLVGDFQLEPDYTEKRNSGSDRRQDDRRVEDRRCEVIPIDVERRVRQNRTLDRRNLDRRACC